MWVNYQTHNLAALPRYQIHRGLDEEHGGFWTLWEETNILLHPRKIISECRKKHKAFVRAGINMTSLKDEMKIMKSALTRTRCGAIFKSSL